MRFGFWCLSCWKCCTWSTVKKLSDATVECPYCGSPDYNLSLVKGQFSDGEKIDQYSDRLRYLRTGSDDLD